MNPTTNPTAAHPQGIAIEVIDSPTQLNIDELKTVTGAPEIVNDPHPT